MSSTIALPGASTGGVRSQSTLVEQSRAVAEVQAAVIVAQQCPRDIARAERDMRDACSRLGLANRAFYSVRNRGTGPSVHLARELARIWGNIQYGVHELARDDEAGTSEVEAFAWDVQTNSRSTRRLIIPHERMAKGKRQRLLDLGDVYLNNQNVGARAVRECIFTVLPAWLTDEAQDLCRQTIEQGNGDPLDQRVVAMIEAFAGLDVTEQMITAKLGRPRDRWRAEDIATLQIAYMTIRRGETTVAEEFPTDQAPLALPTTTER